MPADRATISLRHLRRIVVEAKQAFPTECCGLLLGHMQNQQVHIVRPLAMHNASAEPELGFEFDAREQLLAYRGADAEGLEILGHYHSHPNGRVGPSPTDLELARARLDRGFWLIVAVKAGEFVDASLWRLAGHPGNFEQIKLVTVSGPGNDSRDHSVPF